MPCKKNKEEKFFSSLPDAAKGEQIDDNELNKVLTNVNNKFGKDQSNNLDKNKQDNSFAGSIEVVTQPPIQPFPVNKISQI